MLPELCSFCTPWWTSTSDPAPPSRVLSFDAFAFFFDKIVMISNDQFLLYLYLCLSFSYSLFLSRYLVLVVERYDTSQIDSRSFRDRTPRHREAIRSPSRSPARPSALCVSITFFFLTDELKNRVPHGRPLAPSALSPIPRLRRRRCVNRTTRKFGQDNVVPWPFNMSE